MCAARAEPGEPVPAWQPAFGAAVTPAARVPAELRPLDVLAELLPGSGAARGARVLQAQGLSGLQLRASRPRALAFPASRLFLHCDRFPEEFSIIVTLRVLAVPTKVSAAGGPGPASGVRPGMERVGLSAASSRRGTSTSSR